MTYGGRPHGMVCLWCCWFYQWREEGDGKQQNDPSECGQLTNKMTGQVYICTHTHKITSSTQSLYMYFPHDSLATQNFTSATMSVSDSSSVHEGKKTLFLLFSIPFIHLHMKCMWMNGWWRIMWPTALSPFMWTDCRQTKGFFCFLQWYKEADSQMTKRTSFTGRKEVNEWDDKQNCFKWPIDLWTRVEEWMKEWQNRNCLLCKWCQVPLGEWILCLYLGTLVALLKGLPFLMVFKEASPHTTLVNYRC